MCCKCVVYVSRGGGQSQRKPQDNTEWSSDENSVCGTLGYIELRTKVFEFHSCDEVHFVLTKRTHSVSLRAVDGLLELAWQGAVWTGVYCL